MGLPSSFYIHFHLLVLFLPVVICYYSNNKLLLYCKDILKPITYSHHPQMDQIIYSDLLLIHNSYYFYLRHKLIVLSSLRMKVRNFYLLFQ